ncbi:MULTISPECIES: sulfotransferase [unclassified Ruegeria]|uniref:sulfotransferase n=1 Tax=unclassified Ruegeria TaxID=2625375 RepID=UPI001491CA9F|nr:MULTISPECIES: sulfotransferase [unclassified Ruegeria]NOD36593.1 hypothetical protein [Ruegeria sp. HKCCD7296]NOE43833.1 hypothetical protein [Ruegeria sp. HKCCD7319]
MLVFCVSLLTVFGFAIGLWKAGVVPAARSLLASSVSGVSAMFDAETTDHEKETAVRRAAFELLGGVWQLAWRFGLSLAAAAAPIVLADVAGLASTDEVTGLMLRLDYIIAVSVLAILIARFVSKRLSANTTSATQNDAYSEGDRLVHTLAFSTPMVMKSLAATDDRAFRLANKTEASQPPIFITSLARGGTTALLNAFFDMPAIATHQYRDMPFITAPYLWSRLGGKRSDRVSRRERAHGDGLEIDLDSPEAFDEVLWHLYWPDKYRQQFIGLWQNVDENRAACDRLHEHFEKIVALRRPEQEQARYLSKNNANIARLRVLPTYFPGCDIIVPLRRPAAHAASLLRQHNNFLDLQAKDDFVRRYMSDIGHLEFGVLHKPIAFAEFDPAGTKPDQPDYWLRYWIAAFREVELQSDRCFIVTQDDLRSRPYQTMTALLKSLNLPQTDQRFDTYFRNTPDRTPDEFFDAELLHTANALYVDLDKQAVK